MINAMKFLAAAAGTAVLAAAAPAAAQYTNTYPYGAYNPNPYTGTYYGTSPYGNYYGSYGSGQYAYPYGYNYPYGYSRTTPAATRANFAEQACSSVVQQRLNDRGGLATTVQRMLGAGNPRVTSVEQARVTERGWYRVKGLATTNSYGPYGAGAYGALGYSAKPDIKFRCTVYPNGQVADVDIKKR